MNGHPENCSRGWPKCAVKCAFRGRLGVETESPKCLDSVLVPTDHSKTPKSQASARITVWSADTGSFLFGGTVLNHPITVFWRYVQVTWKEVIVKIIILTSLNHSPNGDFSTHGMQSGSGFGGTGLPVRDSPNQVKSESDWRKLLHVSEQKYSPKWKSALLIYL